ncbi:MAG TPA: AsmA family protein [Steroidobacteraceae bacterium]
MRLKRPLILVPAVIALVAVTAFGVLWIGARTPMARRIVAGWVTETTGLPATIETLRIGFLPRPALDIGDLAIAQPPGYGPEPLFEIGRLRVSVPWGSLFGPTSIEIISISDATARLEVGMNGETNWARLGGGAGEPGAEPAKPAWSVGKLNLERGTIEYEDRPAGSRWQLAAINVSAADIAPAVLFPLELRLGGVFGANTIHYAMKGQGRLDLNAGRYEASGLDFRGWAGGAPLPLAGIELAGAMKHAAFESATGIATLDDGTFLLAGIPGEFGGTLNFDTPEMQADFRLKTNAFAPRAPAIAFGHALPATTDPKALGSLQLSLQGRMREGELEFDRVTGRLDDTNFDGRIVPGRRLIRANFDRIDVNRYLAPEVKTARRKKATLEAAVAELAGFDIDAEIRIAEALVAGAKLRDSVIRVERSGEEAP